ncbi:sulfatase-like hydrolase/transferase [Pasteurella atlantica]|uniref:sulfatase-like hydrolase/transferase n=1 Tax=Pasteurellaceae TaxID=712 RepID=UPI00275DCAE2|nr:sulfatase-like hydrolase/transferase [Pasteurella atlantica]MDP8099102.1 sulfatase-like hydrolase/transferase [Pasteurella atlantica]MDP8107128.1 sulfatase-like hydrolase/transferase [Pasteurella atlantica]MDP8116819.1 sulfatase-like hydrolase/transferase [Pasteurella atlantica]
MLKQNIVKFSLLYKYNFFLTTLIFLSFLIFNSHYTTLSLTLSILGAISSAAILYALLYLALFLFQFLGKKGLYFIALCFLIVDIALVTDFFIYRLYHFHINAMVLNILTSPKAFDSIQLGMMPIIFSILCVGIGILFEIYLVNKLSNNTQSLETLRTKNKKINKFILLPLLLIILTEKISYGFASLSSKNELIQPFKAIPLYQPLTFKSFAHRYLGFKVVKQAENYISQTTSLNYPKSPLISTDKLNKVNIFIIASDSINSQYITPEITPNIVKFQQDSLVYNQHFSGGNSTRFGIFSLLYGLNSNYWFSFYPARKGTVLFDYLKSQNYNINIVSSTNTSWPEFLKTAYVNIQQSVYDKFDGEPWEKDQQSSTKLLELIDKIDPKQPQFAFLFMDAPHGNSFPEESHKFPTKGEINYLTLNKDSKDLPFVINGYKNSIYYNDMLFAKIVDKLKEKGLYDNSIIIYTSDHGQEFFSHGNFGHNSSFSTAQTQVPFIVKMPTKEHKEINKLTSHLDVVPTLLSYIGVKNDPKDYSNGYNLFANDFHRNSVFISNWNNNAILTKSYTYVFSNLPNKMFQNEVRQNSDYSLVEDHEVDHKELMKTIEQNAWFHQ